MVKQIQCRVCLYQLPLKLCENIFNMHGEETIAQQIMKCASVEISSNDGHPENICQNCLNDLRIALNFKNTCEQSDKLLNQSEFSVNVKCEQEQEKWPEDSNIKTEKIGISTDYQQTPEDNKLITVKLEDDSDNYLTDQDCNLLDPDFNLTTSNSAKRSGLLYSCILCHVDFDGKKLFSDHIKNDHIKLKDHNKEYIECNHCGKDFTKYEYVRVHIFEMHLNQKRREKKKQQSMLLSKSNKNLREIVKMGKTKENTIKTQQTPEYDTLETVKLEYPEDNSDNYLTDTDTNLSNPDSNLTTSNPDEHYPAKRSGSLYSCMLCQADFDGRKLYSDHITNYHVKLKDDNEPFIECNQCGKEFKKYEYVRAHIFEMHLNQKRREKKKQQCMLLSRNDKNPRKIVEMEKIIEYQQTPEYDKLETVKLEYPEDDTDNYLTDADTNLSNPDVNLKTSNPGEHYPAKRSGSLYTCILCNADFDGRKLFSDHITNDHMKLKDDNETYLECNQCGKEFKKYDYVRAHVFEMHLNQKRREKKKLSMLLSENDKNLQGIVKVEKTIKTPVKKKRQYPCLFCDVIFPNTMKLSEHINTHLIRNSKENQYFQCRYCTSTASNYRSMRTHCYLKHQLQRKKQSNFIDVFLTPTETKNQSKQNKEKETIDAPSNEDVKSRKKFWKCVCQKLFTKTEEFTAHVENEHSVFDTEISAYLVKCFKCDKIFSNYKLMRTHFFLVHLHLRNVHRQMKNRKKAVFKSVQNRARKQTKRYKSPIYCIICEDRFLGREVLLDHVNKNHMHLDGDEMKLNCSECDGKFPAYGPFLAHLRIVHKKYSKGSKQLARITSGTAMNPHICPHCERCFTYRQNLNRHIMVRHEKLKPIKCTHCDMTFINKFDMNKHSLVMHTNEKSLSCDKCDRKFAIWNQLRDHILRSHGLTKQYRCSVCDKRFSTKRDRNAHVKLHGPKTFSCEFCSRSFAIKQYLESHLKSHRKSSAV